MLKTLLLSLLICISSLLFAQKKIILHYSFTQSINGRTGGGKLTQYFSGGKSLELPELNNSLKTDTVYNGASKTVNVMIKGDSKRIPFILKTPGSSGLMYAEQIFIHPTILVVDTLSNFDWKVYSDTKEINGATCTKAETSFRGRKYIAWFKKDDLIHAGPWKFGGLPGIIYEVKDTDAMFTYVLETTEYVDQFPVELKLPDAYKDEVMISHGEFISKWKAVKNDLEKNNESVTYTLFGSESIRHYVAPIQELY